MSRKAIIREASLLEDKAWSVAKKIGYERTTDNAAKFGRIIDGYIGVGWASKETEIAPTDKFKYLNEYKQATYIEKAIALVMFGIGANVDGGADYGSEDSAWGTLCSTSYALGKICGWIEQIPSNQLSLEEGDDRVSNIWEILGSKGGKARHAPMRDLETWLMQKVSEKFGKEVQRWPSANHIAHEFLDDVLEQSRILEAGLTATNGQRTLAKWISAHKKSS